MGQESFVYGGIVGARWNVANPHRLQQLNQQIVATLPTTDDWPFLTRQMFTLPGADPADGLYRSQLIHFGATFKEIEWEWDLWLAKFEHLLGQLFWEEVYLHLRTEATVGDYDYLYKALDAIPSFLEHESPVPAGLWRFSGGPRKFDPDVLTDEREREQVWLYSDGRWQIE